MALPSLTTVDVDNYFATSPRAATWAAVTDPDIQVAEAQLWLGALCWDEKATCCGNDFTLAYTRAVSELALALSANPTALIGGGSSSAAIKRAQLGGLSVEYADAGTMSKSRYGANAPLVLQKFEWLGDILGCWLKSPTGSSRIIARVRS